MSQLIGCTCADGLVLATDRRVEIRDDAGEPTGARFARKLFPMGPRVAVATSGAAVGIEICDHLSRTLSSAGALDFEELEAYLVSSFQRAYDRFVTEGAAWFAAHPDSLTRSYLALAGLDDAGRPVLRFYGSEAQEEPLRRLPVADLLVAPRRMGLEARLARARATGASIAEVRALVIDGMTRLAAGDERVGCGFDLALWDRGTRRLESIP